MKPLISKIFIVDDVVENLKTMVSVFDKNRPEYEIYQTNDSTNVLELAKKIIPDLIITDWDMPKLDGLSLIKQLKQEPLTKNIPVIMATGVNLSSKDLELSLKTGAIDYIRKPIDETELLARTNSVLSLAALHKQNLDERNRELTESSLSLINYNKFSLEVTKTLHELSVLIDTNKKSAKTKVDDLLHKMNGKIKEDSWHRFNLSFDRVHKDFKKNLLKKHPNLTAADLKLCSFIRLGMGNKEIASVLYQSPDSIKVSRSRLRKKFGLDRSENFEAYLIQF